MGPTLILTCVLALYGTDRHFNMRFCLTWDGWKFLHAFLPYMGPTVILTCVLPYMGPTDILTCVFALYGTDGNFNMRFCLIWERRTF